MANKQSFSISASTCSFSKLLKTKNSFTVPVFQRPYSWGNEQIERFTNDIFLGFWGSDRSSASEPFFAGTIQISNQNEIIDGQQRLTTLLVLQKVLDLRFFYGEDYEVKKFIESKVNNGTQDKELEEFLKIETYKSLERKTVFPKDEEVSNIYIRNAWSVNSAISENIRELFTEDEKARPFDCSDFANYIQNQILFVVIETKATLSMDYILGIYQREITR